MHSSGRRSRKCVTRGTAARILAGAVAAGLGLTLVPVLGVTTAASADEPLVGSTTGAPVYATGTPHPSANAPEIAWISWAQAGRPIADGATVTNWHAMGDDTWLEVTCTLSDLSGDGPVAAYTPSGNTWQNGDGTTGRSTDGLGQLYPGMPPAGIRQVTDYGLTRFTVSCEAEVVRYDEGGRAGGRRLGSDPVELGGLVLAEAESLSQGENPASEWVVEHVRATARSSTGSPWRVVDRYQGRCANRTHTATVDVTQAGQDWSARLYNESEQCGDGSATAVLLAQDVEELEVELLGEGYSAAAVGYVLGVDHGDAPQSYGVAGALVRPTWTGGELWWGTTRLAGTVCGYGCGQVTTALATRGGPPTGLGVDTRANTTVPFSADASADVPDEDAFGAGGAPAAVEVEPVVMASYALTTARCRGGDTHVAGWLDWDGDGRFDDDERSDVVPCPGTSPDGDTVTLTWSSVPADAVGGASFLRLRTSTATAELGSGTGPVLAGETEDWPVQLLVTRLALTKSADVPYVTAETGAVRYTVTVTNTGNVGFPAERPAHVVDDLGAALPYGTVGAVTASSGTVVVDGERITWSGPLEVGATVTLTYELALTSIPHAPDAAVRNVALATTVPPGADDAVTCEDGSVTQLAGRCAAVDLPGVGLSVEKTAAVDGVPLPSGATLAPGTTVTWSYVVRNTGSLPVRQVSVADLVTETRDGSPLVTGEPLHLDCGAHGSGTGVTVAELAAGAHVTCTAGRQVVPRS